VRRRQMEGHRIAAYLDLENLVHPYRIRGRWDRAEQALIGLLLRLRSRAVLVGAVAVSDSTAWRRLAFSLSPFGLRMFTHAGGENGADTALIERLRLDVPSSADTVAIGSGDHIFARVAQELREAGRRVVAVAHAGCLSHELYRAVDDVHLLTPPAPTGIAA
jgi:hypothetical protein